MSLLKAKTSTTNLPKIGYRTAKMAIFLSVLFFQVGCGGGGTQTASVNTVNKVASLTPGNGSSDVATSDVISVSFTSPMDGQSIDSSTFTLTGPEGVVSGSVRYDGGTTATFTPIAPLKPLTEYVATLRANIRTNDGKPLSDDQTWKFRTSRDTLARSASQPIPSTYFGLHLRYADTTSSWPTAPFGTWRLWDSYVAWPWLEPLKGEWHFERLDKDVSLAETHNVEIILPLAFTPTWAAARPEESIPYYISGSPSEPANIEDWKNYVRTVATRYKGRIRIYEIWNEPNVTRFYSGSIPKMVELAAEAYKVLKSVDPTIIVVSPACSDISGINWFNQYMTYGGGNFADVIGYHFYVTPKAPEAMIDNIISVKQVMAQHKVGDKELWNTETGWTIENQLSSATGTGAFSKVLNSTEASAYVARTYILNWVSGVNRFCWYGWDDKLMGLVEADGKTIKPAAIAYREINAWLNGSTVVSCSKNSTGTWFCEISKGNGYKGWILWNPDKSVQCELPKEWQAKQVINLLGQKRLIGDTTISVSAEPVLVENTQN